MQRAMFIHKQKGPLIMMVFFLFTGIFSVPMDVLIMDIEQQEPEEGTMCCQAANVVSHALTDH
jgi:hypothetical protein